MSRDHGLLKEARSIASTSSRSPSASVPTRQPGGRTSFAQAGCASGGPGRPLNGRPRAVRPWPHRSRRGAARRAPARRRAAGRTAGARRGVRSRALLPPGGRRSRRSRGRAAAPGAIVHARRACGRLDGRAIRQRPVAHPDDGPVPDAVPPSARAHPPGVPPRGRPALGVRGPPGSVKPANTSSRWASIQAATSASAVAGTRGADQASASSAETPTTGRPWAKARPCTVAIPIRRPVKDPGPEATP